MKVSRRHGRLRLRLEPAETELLTGLLDELLVVLDDVATDPVVQRLFPAAYPDDQRAQTEYRSMTESGLRTERRERIGACAAELATGGAIDLDDPDRTRRWIQVLNDLRLALGTRLGVSEDDPDVDPDDASARPRLIYHWLTAVQDSVVAALLD